MRMPNSYGSITKLKGNRRNPWMVRITTGWTDEGKECRKVLGYFPSRVSALEALTQYHTNPYDLDKGKTTLKDVWEKWIEISYTKEKKEIPNTYKAAYKRLEDFHDMPFSEIRTRHIQGVVDSCPRGFATKKTIKSLCNMLFKFAIDCEIVGTNYASNVKLPTRGLSEIHHPFEPEDLKILWKHTDDFIVDVALALCYTGLRPNELIQMRNENVYLEKRYMVGGMKTAAGKNRVIPIAEKIFPIIEKWYQKENAYLLMNPRDGKPIADYKKLRRMWNRSEILSTLSRKHLLHDGRHTCATLLDNAGVNIKISQLILGHVSSDVTRRVYTHKTIQQLIDAINLI